ncbi:MAG: hypothetical protein WBA74_28065, partial [Cyclobacteriaceae bacterium]
NYSFEGNYYKLLLWDHYQFAQYLCLGAPNWVIRRFLKMGRDHHITGVLNTLGEGVQRFESKTEVTPGTFLLDEAKNNIGVVIATNSNGRPVQMIKTRNEASGTIVIREVVSDTIKYFWTPSIVPFQYSKDEVNSAYKDWNRFLGNLHIYLSVWGKLGSSFNAIFGFQSVKDEEIIGKKLFEVLDNARGKTHEDWYQYLSGIGKGLQKPDAIKIQAGDFLFHSIDSSVRSFGTGIAISNTEMIFLEYSYSQFRKGTIDQILAVWRPEG